MILEANDLKEMSVNNRPVTTAIDTAVNVLKGDLTWVQREPSLKQNFCLQFLCMCTTRIPVSSDTEFNWMREYSIIINKLGMVFHSYLKRARKQIILCGDLPEEVRKNPSRFVSKYFEWIQKLHIMLSSWSLKLDRNLANYDDIHWYHKDYYHIYKLAEAVAGTSLVLSSDKVSSLQLSFLEEFEKLNQLLLKYIPDDPKAGW